MIAWLASSLLAADSAPKDDVSAAAKKLGENGNYSWTTTVASEGGGGFAPGPIEGKTEKDGYTFVSMSLRDNTTEVVLKGGKGALKTDEGWKSLSEAAEDSGGGGGFNPTAFVARRMQSFKAPAAEAADLAEKTKDLKMADGIYSGNLTEDGAKQLLTFRRRSGGGPDISGAKGSTRFWVKDGLLSKYEYHVEGTVSFNGNDRDVNRTTTVQIKDVGSTKVTVPEEASKKAS